MKGLGSDNQAPVHPRIMKAIERANNEHAMSYGMDEWNLRFQRLMKDQFGPETEAYFCFNGTAANVLALGQLVRPHHAVLASSVAHLLNDECGAPQRALGCQIIAVPTPDGKLTPELLKPYLIRRGDQHASQVHAISITQPTELGTVYTLEELARLSQFAKAERLLVHMDGSRLVNAAVALRCDLRSMTGAPGSAVQIDALSLGGTKNGLLFGEAVLFFRRGLDEDFRYSRKQLMQLPSKTRFLAAQFLEFLGTDLWQINAGHANQMAERLAQGLQSIPEIEITQKCQANAVFARLPKSFVAPLRENLFFYVWDERTFECRFMTSWDTTRAEIDGFIAKARELNEGLK